MRTKHGDESWSVFVVWNVVSLSSILYHCSYLTVFMFVFGVLDAGVVWWRPRDVSTLSMLGTLQGEC